MKYHRVSEQKPKCFLIHKAKKNFSSKERAGLLNRDLEMLKILKK
jgi:hypothetical protein